MLSFVSVCSPAHRGYHVAITHDTLDLAVWAPVQIPPMDTEHWDPSPALNPPATDIWWSRPVQTCSLEDSSAPLWSLYLVAIEVTGMVGASYWNALLLERFLKLF